MSSKSARKRERLEQTWRLPEPAALVAEVMAAPEPPPTKREPQAFPAAIRVRYEYTHWPRRD